MLERIIERLQPYPPTEMQPEDEHRREAAVLLPLTRNAVSPELVFILRAEHLNTHSGQVAFPGGMWEIGDPSLLHTALRETHEEISLSPDEVVPVARLPSHMSRYEVKVTPYIGLIPEEVTLIPNLDELHSIFRVPVTYLADRNNLKIRDFGAEGKQFTMPCFEFEDYIIWGLTMHMVADFLQMVFDLDLQYEEFYERIRRL